MKKFMVRVTESINHDYLVEAENEDEAVEAYYRLSAEELKTNDLDGESDWDKPWDVVEYEGLLRGWFPPVKVAEA